MELRNDGAIEAHMAKMSLAKISSQRELDLLLSGLQNLDLSGQIVYQNSVLKAHGGYCDIFIGRWMAQSTCICTVAVKRLRVHILSERDFAKVGVQTCYDVLSMQLMRADI